MGRSRSCTPSRPTSASPATASRATTTTSRPGCAPAPCNSAPWRSPPPSCSSGWPAHAATGHGRERRAGPLASGRMSEEPYFDVTGEPSDAPGRFIRVADDVTPLELIPGLRFQPVTTDSVMTNLVTFAPGADAATHHHFEQQIAIMISGELTFTVGGETRVMPAGALVVIPPHVPHGGVAGPDGCVVIDVFTPPREGIVRAMG